MKLMCLLFGHVPVWYPMQPKGKNPYCMFCSKNLYKIYDSYPEKN